jgi:hypothetical protein
VQKTVDENLSAGSCSTLFVELKEFVSAQPGSGDVLLRQRRMQVALDFIPAGTLAGGTGAYAAACGDDHRNGLRRGG